MATSIKQSVLETDRYHFIETDTNVNVKYRSTNNNGGSIMSAVSYRSKVRIRISTDFQKVKYRPIILVGRYIGWSLIGVT